MSNMPEWYFPVVMFLFGLVIGSFLNVVIYRFHTGKSLNDRSHCLSCGTKLAWYELFPVFSYIALRGRCRSCSSFIPYRYVLVEVLTGGLFWLTYLKMYDPIMLVLALVFVSVLVVVAVYDLYHLIIPDELSAGLALVALSMVSYQAWFLEDWGYLGWSLAAGGLAFLFFASLWWISGGRWLGFGDAKLAISLGMLVGIGGVFSLVVWSFWIGAIISILIMVWQRLRLHMYSSRVGGASVTMKSEVPFAPFLIAAFLLVFFFEADVLLIISTVMERLWF